MFYVINNSTLVKVDCIVGQRNRWETERFERRVKMQLGDFGFWAIGKEDLIVAKLNWAYESLSDRQFEDIAALVESGIDADLLERLIAGDRAERAWDAFEEWKIRLRK